MWKKVAFITVGSIFLLTFVHLYFIAQLKLDYDFESFFPIGDEDLTYYQEFREKFENDNDYLLIGFQNDPGIFASSFLQKVDSFTTDLENHKSVLSLASPTRLFNPVFSPAGLFKIPVLHINEPDRYKQDSTRIYEEGKWVGSFFAEDGKALALLLKHTPMILKPEGDSLVADIEYLAGKYQLSPLFLAGKAKAQGVYIDKMKFELIVFLSISVVLVTLFLIVAYRSVWNVIVPLVVVMLSVIWILGVMGIFNKPLDVMLVLLPSIMFVVAMSDVVHILTKYIEELRAGLNRLQALRITLKEVGLATFLTSLTTAIGFLTLFTASIKPIREFGLYTAIGVFVAFLLAFSLLPAILMLIKKPPVVDNEKNRRRWLLLLMKAFNAVLNNYRTIFYVSLVIIAVALIGISRVEINTFLLEDIPEDDPLRKEFIFFDNKFGGYRPLEIAIKVKDTSRNIFDWEILEQLEKVETYLTDQYEARNIISPLQAIKSLNQAVNGGLTQYFRLPDDNNGRKKIQKNLRYLKSNNADLKLFADDYRTSRISGKIKDIGSKMSLERNTRLEAFFRSNVDSSLVQLKITGTSLLIDKNNQYLTQNMIEGLGIAFLVIAAIVALLFRSVRMIIIVLIPNVIPLIVVAAIMGYSGITLKLSTSIIFTIAFGIAVDDTIHFISKLKLELDKGKSLLYALKRTYLSTGKAIIITTIILAGGFLTLILSGFGGTYYTGLLVSLTLVLAVLADLILLPVLLIMFFKKNKG
ncbi:MAG: MMPL family transporter [Cytophagales bacterium]|nr:MMPL family transporter [Cytophagales bacterium]